MKRTFTESIEQKTDDEVPTKKRKLNTTNTNSKKPKKTKAAKPYQCRGAGYIVGNFTASNTARLDFKALFGMNRLTIAWSDVTSSQIRNSFSGLGGLFGGFDFAGLQQAANLMNNMTTERVEINIDNIDSIQLTDGGAAIKMVLITNFPPIFTKQMNSRPGKGNKFAKATDPTNGNAMKYKKHIIFLSKKPTLNNITIVENKLKNGSAKLKRLFEEKAYENYEQITNADRYEQSVIDEAKNIGSKKVKKSSKGKRNKNKKKREIVNDENTNTNNKKPKRKVKTKRKYDDSDEDWVP